MERQRQDDKGDSGLGVLAPSSLSNLWQPMANLRQPMVALLVKGRYTKIPIRLLVVEGTCSRREAKKTFKIAKNKLKALGVKLKLRGIKHVPHPVVHVPEDKPYAYTGLLAAAIIREHQPLIPDVICHILCPAIPNTQGLGGAASMVCADRSRLWSISTGGRYPERTLLMNTLYPAGCIMAHEVAHLLGAEHDEGLFSLMHKGLNQKRQLTKSLEFLSRHRAQVKRCLSSGHIWK